MRQRSLRSENSDHSPHHRRCLLLARHVHLNLSQDPAELKLQVTDFRRPSPRSCIYDSEIYSNNKEYARLRCAVIYGLIPTDKNVEVHHIARYKCGWDELEQRMFV